MDVSLAFIVKSKESELFNSLGSNPAFVNITATDFELLPGPSRVTGVA